MLKPIILSFFLLCSNAVFASNRAAQAVVDIEVVCSEYDYDSPWSTGNYMHVGGSGFLIEGGYILTNAHVVNDSTIIEVKAQNGQTSYAEIVAVSHEGDLALLQLDDPSILSRVSPLKIRKEMADLNAEVTVMGFPMVGETLCVTHGRVIQTEMDWYVQSFRDLLLHKVDVTAFNGNSGGPVLIGEEVVGVLHQGTDEYFEIIPTPVILHFLKEFELGQIQGYPSFVFYEATKNPSLRQFYQMRPEDGGALVRHVPENHFLYGEIFPGDIVLAIDGYLIDQDQKVELENGLRVGLDYLITQKFYGENIRLTLLREGRERDLVVYVDPEKQGKPLVLEDRYDLPPTYYIYAGLVFQPLDRNYWRQFNQASYSDRLDFYRLSGKVEDGRTEVVMLTLILPDEVNKGYYSDPDMGIIAQVNGRKIKDMHDLIDAFESHSGPYHQILTEADYEIILSVDLAQKRHQRILNRYRIPADRSPDL